MSDEQRIAEMADEQLGDLTVLEELVRDLENDREIYDSQIERAAEAVESCQDNAVEIVKRGEQYGGPIE